MRKPPKKQSGQGLGHRTIAGAVFDVRTGSGHLGVSQKTMYGYVARRLVPFRKLNGRIVFLKDELDAWLHNLEGCTPDEVKANIAQRYGEGADGCHR